MFYKNTCKKQNNLKNFEQVYTKRNSSIVAENGTVKCFWKKSGTGLNPGQKQGPASQGKKAPTSFSDRRGESFPGHG